MSSLRYTLVAIRKDIGRFLKDPLALLLWICMPVMIGLLVNLAFGGSDGETPTARLLIADEDDSLLSGLLTGAMGQGELAQLINTENVTRAEGEREVYRGRATALLTVPEGFGERFLNGEADTLRLLTNPAQTILPGIVEETLEILTAGGGLLRDFLGPQIDLINAESGSGSDTFADETISTMAVDINHLMEGAGTWLFPPAITFEHVAADTATVAEAGTVPEEEKTLLWYFFPSLLTLLILFAGLTLSSDIWEERRAGTIRRGLSAPYPVRWLLLGKFLAGSLVVLIVMLIATAFGRFVLRLPHQSWLAGGLFFSLTGAAFISGMTSLQILFRTERGASMVVMIVIMVMMFGGGSFFPFEAMPDFLQAIVPYLPNGWALTHYKAVTEGFEPAGALIGPTLLLFSVFILGWLFCSMRITRQWGSES